MKDAILYICLMARILDRLQRSFSDSRLEPNLSIYHAQRHLGLNPSRASFRRLGLPLRLGLQRYL